MWVCISTKIFLPLKKMPFPHNSKDHAASIRECRLDKPAHPICTWSSLRSAPPSHHFIKAGFDNVYFDSQDSSPEFLLLSLTPYHPLLTKISFIFSNLYYKACKPASTTGQWVEPLAAKPDELSSSPRHKWKERTNSRKLSLTCTGMLGHT